MNTKSATLHHRLWHGQGEEEPASADSTAYAEYPPMALAHEEVEDLQGVSWLKISDTDLH